LAKANQLSPAAANVTGKGCVTAETKAVAIRTASTAITAFFKISTLSARGHIYQSSDYYPVFLR